MPEFDIEMLSVLRYGLPTMKLTCRDCGFTTIVTQDYTVYRDLVNTHFCGKKLTDKEIKKYEKKGCKNCEHKIKYDKIHRTWVHDGYYVESKNCQNGNIQCKCQKPEPKKG